MVEYLTCNEKVLSSTLTFGSNSTSMENQLIFRYGTMGSAKSANLLITAYNLEEHGKYIICLKPTIDNKVESGFIRSRIDGIRRTCYSIGTDDDIADRVVGIVKAASVSMSRVVVFVDEAQFLSGAQVDDLVKLVDLFGITVICYGIRTSSAGKLFPGSARLFEMADTLEEIESICDCGKKTVINAKILENGLIEYFDETKIKIGENKKYKAMCRSCWNKGRVDK